MKGEAGNLGGVLGPGRGLKGVTQEEGDQVTECPRVPGLPHRPLEFTVIDRHVLWPHVPGEMGPDVSRICLRPRPRHTQDAKRRVIERKFFAGVEMHLEVLA